MLRSQFLAQGLAMACAPVGGFALGMATRNAQAQPRGKPFGIPFHSRLADAGRDAGLVHSAICGEAAKKDYIVETVGGEDAPLSTTTTMAGWIFVLSGTRLGTPAAGASNVERGERLRRNWLRTSGYGIRAQALSITIAAGISTSSSAPGCRGFSTRSEFRDAVLRVLSSADRELRIVNRQFATSRPYFAAQWTARFRQKEIPNGRPINDEDAGSAGPALDRREPARNLY